MERRTPYKHIAASSVVGAAFTMTHITHVSIADLSSEVAGFFFFGLYFLVLLSALAYGLLGAVVGRLRQFSPRARIAWLVGAPLLGVMATLVIPTFPPQPWFGEEMEVTITPLNERNPAAQGSEVWLLRASNGGQALDLATFAHDGGWVWRDNGELVALTGTTAPLRWRGQVRSALMVELLEHPWSGRVRVQVGDQAQELDLYAATARSRMVTLAPPPSLWTRAAGGLWLADIISCGVLLTAALLLLATWRPQARSRVLPWFWYTLPCVVVWSCTLLVFFPGLMSSDSLDQWDQMLRGKYNDVHPAFHTLTMWLITRVWLSPAAVALAQIGALALVCGLTVRELALLGVSRWVQVVLIVLFALSPVNNLMVITLWKDIPYAIALLCVFWMLLRVWRTDGVWLRARMAPVAIGAALAALALYRHNGAPMALLILPALLLVGRQARWRQVVVIGGVSVALVLLVKVGLYRALDVASVPPWFARQMQIHQLGAFVVHSEQLDGSDRALLERLLPRDEWHRRYWCYSLNSLLYGDPLPDQHLFDTNVGEFTALWQKLALRDPATLARHQWCLTNLIWRVTQSEEAYLSTWPRDWLIQSQWAHLLGVGPASIVPSVRDQWIVPWLERLEQPEWVWLVWRPALYLYLALFCVAVAMIRHRSWRLAGLALPVVAQSLIWMLLLTVQDFRFQYGTYVIGLLALGLVFLPVPMRGDAECDGGVVPS